MKYCNFFRKTISLILCVLILVSLIPQLSFEAKAAPVTLTDNFDGYSALPVTTSTATAATPYLSKFTDNSTVADYAKTEIAAMVNEGIVTGDGDTLNPLGDATEQKPQL